MKNLNAYVTFNGNCREAMKFYEKALGAELHVMSFADGKMNDMPKEAQNRVMHARLRKGNITLMASDTMPGTPFQQGNNFSLSIGAESIQEAERLSKTLSEDGKVTMPLQETFWAQRFGMLVDQFGVSWMINFEKPM